MDMDDNFIPTSWLTLTITNKTRHIADDGTFDVAITGQRGAHLIELLPKDKTAPWGTMGDDLCSKVQLPCQVDVKGRLSINAREDEGGFFNLIMVVEKWRIVKSPSQDFLVSEDIDRKVKCDDCNNKTARQGKAVPFKSLIGSANMSESKYKRSKSVQPSSNQLHFYSPRCIVSAPSHQQPLPTISVFKSPQAALPSYLPHVIRPRLCRLRMANAFYFDGRGYCRPTSEGAGVDFPPEFDGLYAFEQAFSDGRRRIVRIAINAQAEESVNAMVIYEDWR